MQPVELAESALLGALLVDPPRVAEVPWLDAGDFVGAGRGRVFSDIRANVASGRRVDAASTAGSLRVDRLRTVTALTPRRAAGDVELYGRMVLEASIRRQVRALGVEVGAATLGEPASVPARVIRESDRVLDRVDRLRERWTGQACAPKPLDERRAWHATARRLARLGPPSPDSVAAAERGLIAAAITGVRTAVLVERFAPGDFAERSTAATWLAVATLNDTGRPVNVVTVAWEQQRGSAQYGHGLSVDELHALSIVPPVDIDAYADVVAGARLHRLAGNASRNLVAAAGRPGLAPDDVLTTTQVSVEALRDVAERIAPRVADPAVAARLAASASRPDEPGARPAVPRPAMPLRPIGR